MRWFTRALRLTGDNAYLRDQNLRLAAALGMANDATETALRVAAAYKSRYQVAKDCADPVRLASALVALDEIAKGNPDDFT